MTNETIRRIVFDEIKSLALKEAGRAHQLANKYAEQLELRAQNVVTKIAELSTQLEALNKQAQELQDTANTARAQAEQDYADTLKAVLASFDLELPVNAKIQYEDGVPVSAEILPQDPVS